MNKLPLLGLLGLSACGWNLTPRATVVVSPLWDAHTPVSATDGLYVELPHRGRLVRVTPDGAWTEVELGDGRLAALSTDGSGERVAAFVDRFRCEAEDPRLVRKVEYVEDCDHELVVSRDVMLVEDGVAGEPLAIPGEFYNALAWSPDGSTAVAWLDVEQEVELSGVVDLSSVAVLDLTTGEAQTVNIGFAASGLLYTDDGSKLVVLSRSEVALIDLAASPPVREVSFPLTLDPDDDVDPVGVALTPSQEHALISVSGSLDLYILDLVDHSVNLVALSGTPSAMLVDADTDQTVITYTNQPRVDVLEHTLFDLESIELDAAMGGILDRGTSVVLYNTGSGNKDAYLLDLESLKTWEFRLENPPVDMQLAPGGDFAVALTRAESGFGEGVEALYDANPGMEVLDLRADETGRVDTDTHPLLLEADGLGLAFAAGDTALEALVLQKDTGYLYALDLYSGDGREIELEAAPVAIGALPGGAFWVTQDEDLGTVSFVEPLDDQLVTAGGFAVAGLFAPTRLVAADEGGE